MMPKINFSVARKVILISVFASVLFVSGYYFGINGFRIDSVNFPKIEISRETPRNRLDVNFSLFWKVWDILDASYYDKSKLNPSDMVYGAISGMVAGINDPYTAFLSPEENKIVEEDLSGSFEGIGIQIGYKGKQMAVIAPLADTPAEEAGIKAGDYIVGIIDEAKGVEVSTVGMNINDAVAIIRGKAGTKVTLLLLRDGNGDVIKTEVVRKAINVPSVTLSFVGEGEDIAHISVLKFSAETYSEWQEEVLKILSSKDKISGIILDLRNNPGGYLQGAVDLAGEFMNRGEVVVIEERGGSENKFETDRMGKFGNIPTIIMVNKGSASASEILAGALRDNKGIKLLGEVTFGKGTIQEPIELEKGSNLHITTAKWLTPKGFWVNEKGLEPDIIVSNNPDTEEDEQLLEAIKALGKL